MDYLSVGLQEVSLIKKGQVQH